MKNEAQYAKPFAALWKKISAAHKGEPRPAAADPVTQLVIGFLEWNSSSTKRAGEAHARLMAQLVDLNDLRVSLPHELIALIGADYPLAEERAIRLHEVLNEIYIREHDISLADVASKPKKQIRQYLDTLPGMTNYVASQAMLLCFGAHAVPVDDHLLALLKEQQAVDPEATVDEASAFLERQIKASDGPAAHALLTAWSDQHKLREDVVLPSPTTPAGRAAAQRSTKKTSKKTSKKTTKKTTAKTSKPTSKKTTKQTTRKGRR